MKWVNSLTAIRHGQSEYNNLKHTKDVDPYYQEFKKAFEENYQSTVTRQMAQQMSATYSLNTGDFDTPLTQLGKKQGIITGSKLSTMCPLPDLIFCSPYVRTVDTKNNLCLGWPELANVEIIYDDRIREQEHGLALLYSDWRVFQTLHPEQKKLNDLLGDYWYQYPQGESVSQVRDRIRIFVSMLIRECAGMNVMLITHHLTILSIRANLERLSPQEFIDLDAANKPFNCGLTQYIGKPNLGQNGKLLLNFYNTKLYHDEDIN